MYTLNNALSKKQAQATKVNHEHWLKFKTLPKGDMYTNELSSICQQYQNENRWILMIDPDEQPLSELSHNENIDDSKLLRVDTQGKAISIEKIQKTLAQGNCAALVLCRHQISKEHLATLQSYARQGKTQCIILNTPAQLH